MEYYKELRKYVGHRPLILPGSVVIIQNEFGDVLLQEREKGVFGLPGGLMDLGESFEETAVREVFEEANLNVTSLELKQVFSGKEFYYKVDNGDEFYSVTAVFIANSYEGSLKANLSESIGIAFYSLEAMPKGLLPSSKKFLKTCL
ncbi:MAG: NUDIX domain-containing protein [Firmicutes bacterium]|nr:NUDIX domain-containing protein [Bacillota bacterium]